MYLPAQFEETRVEVLHELMRRHTLAALVTLGSAGLEANHIPLEIDPEPAPFGTLRGHVARANPVWRDVSAGVDALAIFQGVHAYVSPAWYLTKQDSGKVVPTYNYVVVHAYGRPRIVDDAVWLRNLVGRLTAHHEAGKPEPWKVEDAPADYIDKQLGAIVGIEIPVTRLTGKWKVSQNRPEPDRDGVVRAFSEMDTPDAREMARLVKESGR